MYASMRVFSILLISSHPRITNKKNAFHNYMDETYFEHTHTHAHTRVCMYVCMYVSQYRKCEIK